MDNVSNKANLKKLYEEYVKTDKFQRCHVIGLISKTLTGFMCPHAMLKTHQCMFSLCFPCYLKYEESKKEENAEKFVCINNGFGGCGHEKHDPKELEAIDAMSVREYMRDKYRRDRTNFNEDGVFCLPLSCSGCGKWWVVDKNKVV